MRRLGSLSVDKVRRALATLVQEGPAAVLRPEPDRPWDPVADNRRIHDFDPRKLPNPHLAAWNGHGDGAASGGVTPAELSVGYPSWSLLYYAFLCTLSRPNPVVVETGTNVGLSSIVLAQVLKDTSSDAVVRTVDMDEASVANARQNVKRAGLEGYVEFHVGDSLGFLRRLVREQSHVDFVFLDDNHERGHVVEEFSIIRPKVTASQGTVYFDNSAAGGVASALRHIKRRYGGNIVRFDNCSWSPPGNAIWQPTPKRFGTGQ